MTGHQHRLFFQLVGAPRFADDANGSDSWVNRGQPGKNSLSRLRTIRRPFHAVRLATPVRILGYGHFMRFDGVGVADVRQHRTWQFDVEPLLLCLLSWFGRLLTSPYLEKGVLLGVAHLLGFVRSGCDGARTVGFRVEALSVSF